MASIPEEMSLRLAWYLEHFGGIPELEQKKLWFIANGISNDAEAKRLRELAADVLEHFQEI